MIKSFHEFYLYEWTPYQICISMHIVINDVFNGDNKNKILEINNILKRINNYFNDNYHTFSMYLQPELSKVRIVLLGFIFSIIFSSNLIILE